MIFNRLTRTTILLTLALFTAGAAAAEVDGFVGTFDVKPENFVASGKSDFFVLKPGYQLTYEGAAGGVPAKLVVTVLDATKTIDGVKTRVVERRRLVNDRTVEVARDYVALDKATNDAYRFGRDVDAYEGDQGARLASTWASGASEAHYAMLMPAKPQSGQKFLQSNAPKLAMDRLEVLSVGVRGEVPAGAFDGCVKAKQSSPLEPNVTRYQVFAPGVGMIIDGDFKLVKKSNQAEPPMDPRDTDAASKKPAVPIKVAREALGLVGTDPAAEAIWKEAINDPNLSSHQRSDLIEDLNEEGFPDPKHLTKDDLPLVLNRLDLIEQLAPQAMDDVNTDAFNEAYKDLTNMADKLTR